MKFTSPLALVIALIACLVALSAADYAGAIFIQYKISTDGRKANEINAAVTRIAFKFASCCRTNVAKYTASKDGTLISYACALFPTVLEDKECVDKSQWTDIGQSYAKITKFEVEKTFDNEQCINEDLLPNCKNKNCHSVLCNSAIIQSGAFAFVAAILAVFLF
jgi:hypothetical protein